MTGDWGLGRSLMNALTGGVISTNVTYVAATQLLHVPCAAGDVALDHAGGADQVDKRIKAYEASRGGNLMVPQR